MNTHAPYRNEAIQGELRAAPAPHPLAPSKQTAPPVNAITLTSYGSLEQMFKVADYLSKSSIVPKRFQQEPGSVLIALNMASRLRLDPFMVMQNIYDVHGTPGLSGQFAIALLSRSPKYSRVEYQYINGKDYKDGMRVVGHRKDDPQHPDIGTAITPEMVSAEKWDEDKVGKTGYRQVSKWKTMPEQMYRYRAASFFARAFCPEELMGMQTAEELEESHSIEQMRNVTPAAAKHEADSVDTPLIAAPAAAASAPKAEKKPATPAPANECAGSFDELESKLKGNGKTWRDLAKHLTDKKLMVPKGTSREEFDKFAAWLMGQYDIMDELRADGWLPQEEDLFSKPVTKSVK